MTQRTDISNLQQYRNRPWYKTDIRRAVAITRQKWYCSMISKHANINSIPLQVKTAEENAISV